MPKIAWINENPGGEIGMGAQKWMIRHVYGA